MTDNSRMLHLVNKSPFERNSLSSCLRLAKKGSAILLIEDGVYGALSETSVSAEVSAQIGNFDFYVLSEDLAVRGITEQPKIDGVTLVDYDGFVDLVAETSSVQSWL